MLRRSFTVVLPSIRREGAIGLHLGAFNVSTVAYKTDMNGRISCSKEGWKNFISGEDLQNFASGVNHCEDHHTRNNLNMMFVINIIDLLVGRCATSFFLVLVTRLCLNQFICIDRW